MAVTTVYTYPLDGSKKDFSVPFEYLARKFVAVTLIGTAGRKLLVLNTDYRFVSKTAIQTTQAWGAGSGYTTIEVKRNTSATDRLVSFSDGSILRATDMNLSQVQTLHVAEEARNAVSDTISVNGDGMLDARGRRLVNLQSAKEGTDAVTYQQVLDWSASALNSANAAKAARDQTDRLLYLTQTSQSAAKASEDNSATYRDQARTAKDQAATSATGASTSATGAATSAANAKTSETNAKTSETNSAASAASSLAQADRAKTEADKLGNANAFMGSVSAVGTDNVTWKAGYQLRATSFKAGRHSVTDGGLTSDGSDGRLRVGGSDATFADLSYLYIQPKSDTNNAHLWVVKRDGSDRGVLYNQADGSWVLRTGSQKALGFDTNGNLNVPGLVYSANRKLVQYGDRIMAGTGQQIQFCSNGTNFGITNGQGQEALSVTNGGNNAAGALMSFHREGSFAAYFGLDVDNQWAVGGWSMGTQRFRLWHEGNLNPGDYVRYDNLRQELGGRGASEVGTYAFLWFNGSANPGDTVGGGSLYWGSYNSKGGAVGGGTWRCMGYVRGDNATLWLRVN